MKHVFAATILFAATMSINGQSAATQSSPCALMLAQSPAVRGVKLGMKTADVLALFPGSADQDDVRNALSRVEGYPHFGVVSINFDPSRYSTKDRFTGITNFSFLLVDGRVGQFEVQYLPPPLGPKWQRPDDFVSKIAEAYKLPPAANWTTDPNVASWKTLKCEGFQLKASTLNYQGVLSVAVTETPWTTQRQREAEFEESVRREFKP
jgi:hypothetical protein